MDTRHEAFTESLLSPLTSYLRSGIRIFCSFIDSLHSIFPLSVPIEVVGLLLLSRDPLA
ncbi:hypothetical protein A2U01_0098735, partial [Trifolium medium]|nr:hypothetical protein [Trifolium medium]